MFPHLKECYMFFDHCSKNTPLTKKSYPTTGPSQISSSKVLEKAVVNHLQNHLKLTVITAPTGSTSPLDSLTLPSAGSSHTSVKPDSIHLPGSLQIKSTHPQITCGVPQGSGPGPVLFILYSSPLVRSSAVMDFHSNALPMTHSSMSVPQLLPHLHPYQSSPPVWRR